METRKHVTFPVVNTPGEMLAHMNLSSAKQLLFFFFQQDIFHQETKRKVLLDSEISGSANIMSILLGFSC